MTHYITPRRSTARSICYGAILLLGFTGIAWGAPDVLVSGGNSMLDIEFDTAGKTPRYIYCQPTTGLSGPGTLYAGRVKLDRSLTTPANLGMPCTFEGNGPEWGLGSSPTGNGTFVVYLVSDTSTPSNDDDLIMQYIRPVGITGWTSPSTVTISQTLTRPNVVYPSQYLGTDFAYVVFMLPDQNGFLTTQTLDGTSVCTVPPQGFMGNFPRFSSYERALTYTKGTSPSTREVFSMDPSLTECTKKQRTFDGNGLKSTASSWYDPNYGGVVYGALIGNNYQATDYNLYDSIGNVYSFPIATALGATTYGSVETFQYNNQSYLLYVSQKSAGDWGIYVTNLDSGMTSEMSDSQTAMFRYEPEVGFVPNVSGGTTPQIYYSHDNKDDPNNRVVEVYRTGVTALPQ